MVERERVSFELTADERAAGRARHRVVRLARRCVRDEGADTLGLLVSEVVTNAVRHGGDGGELEVAASLDRDAVRVEVRDAGGGFVPTLRELSSEQVGGWGLFLVEQLASAWGVSSKDRTTVWFELPCNAAPQPL